MKKVFCITIFCAFICGQAAQKDDWHERLVKLNDNPKNKKRLASFKRRSLDDTGTEKAERKFTAIKEPTPASDTLRKSGSLK